VGAPQSGPRRLVASLLALVAAIGVVSATQSANPAYACACGAFAPSNDPNGTVTLSDETAMVMIKDGQETIDMRLAVDSVTTQTGLIVPTPSPATVTLGSTTAFAALATEMTPQTVKRDRWWSWPPGAFGAPGSSAGAPAPQPSAPVVLSQVQLGPLEATTLSANDAAGLTAWLDANGYGLPQAVTDRLSHYVERNWSFVAIKLTGDTPLSGDLAPISFTFSADQFVYPEFLSQAATTSQRLALYIFADHRQQVTFLDGGGANANTDWARQVKSSALTPFGAYLTAVSMNFYSPSNQITDDLSITRAANDDEVGTQIVVDQYMTILGIPAGWLLVAFGLVVVLLVALMALVPGRRDRRDN